MKSLRLDEINCNILEALLKDARTSFTELARQNKITVSSVRSRYNNLKKLGVITGAITLINPEKIGISCIGILGIKVKPENVKEAKDYLDKQPYITSTWKRIQEINIGAWFVIPKFEDFSQTMDTVKRQQYVRGIQPLIHVGRPFGVYPENLIVKRGIEINQKPIGHKEFSTELIEFEKSYISTPELQQMNKIDRQIARVLSKNARTPFSAIAKQLNISTSNVINIYKELRENNFFVKSSITVDMRKLGYRGNIMIYIKTSPGTDVEDIQRKLLKYPNLITMHKTIGEWDMSALIPIATFEEIFEIKEYFRALHGIDTVQFDINTPFSKWPMDGAHYIL